MLQPFPQLSIFTNVHISSAILERKGSWVRTQTLRKSGRGNLILRAFSVIFSIWRKPQTDFLLTICYCENRPRIPFGRARANARNVSLISSLWYSSRFTLSTQSIKLNNLLRKHTPLFILVSPVNLSLFNALSCLLPLLIPVFTVWFLLEFTYKRHYCYQVLCTKLNNPMTGNEKWA